MKKIEKEIKAEIKNKSSVEKILKEVNFVKKTQVIDKYLDTKDKDLFKKGIFIRIRNSKLDIKFNPNMLDESHTSCDEYSYNYPLEKNAHMTVIGFLNQFIDKANSEKINVFEAFKLIDFVTIDKERKIYENDIVEVSLDSVKSLGEFIEIEIKKDETVDYLLNLAKTYNLNHISVGYVELFLKKHDFDLYMQGRYILPEDSDT